jgi:hypothetical protein
MLDPRIYRTGLIVVGLAVVVLAFSLQDQQGALSPSLAPDAFNGQNVSTQIATLAASYPDRRPGSEGDYSLATLVAQRLDSYGRSGFSVSTDTFSGRTADGPRTLENVVATRPGVESGSVVIVAPRDARGSPAVAALSGTATLLELARDLAGETLNRTVVLASTSGSQGTAGAIRLASVLPGPIDAVIVLGDLASPHARQPIVIPWSASTQVAPPRLRNTLSAALGSQAALGAGSTSLGGQFAHLAFPLTITQQGPFGARGYPAVTLSMSGERGPSPTGAVGDQALVQSLGRAVLQTISALDNGPRLPSASPYLLLAGKVVPGWAIALFVLALIVPVLLTAVDGLARARRRRHSVWRWTALVLAAALPFVLGAAVLVGARVAGVIHAAPPGPVPAGAVPLTGGGIAALIVAALVAVAAVVLLAPQVRRLARREGSGDGAAPALLLVLAVVTFVIWVENPFAALLLAPALHLWLPAIKTDLNLRLPFRLALLLIGVVPVALIALYYSVSLGYGPLDEVWTAALLIAGGGVAPAAVLEWSIVLGCLLGAFTVSALATREARQEPAPVTVRGPITYAGPGSLGGTKSALRR